MATLETRCLISKPGRPPRHQEVSELLSVQMQSLPGQIMESTDGDWQTVRHVPLNGSAGDQSLRRGDGWNSGREEETSENDATEV